MACYLDMSSAERSSVAVGLLDPSGRILKRNPAWEFAWWPAGTDPVSQSLFAHIDAAEVDGARDALSHCLRERTVTCVTVFNPAIRDDRMLLTFWPGDADRVIVIALRVGEPAAAARMRQQLSGLMLMASEALLTTDAALKITSCNHGAELIFGYGAAELIGRPLEDLIPARHRAGHRKHVAAFAGGGRDSLNMSERGAISALRKDGTEFPAEASIAKSGSSAESGFTIVLRDITDHQRIESDLHEARWAAEQASMAKSQFLATMSHELRTPLNAIIGFSQVIENRLFGDDVDRYVAYAADIHRSGKHLLDMINDILDLSRIESGIETLHMEPASVAKLIDDSLMLVRERARVARVTLAVSVADDVPDARVDRRRMRQVLINLLTNAIKFTPAGGQILLRAERERDGLSITISDTGVGIPAQHLGTIMEPFIQVPEHRTLNPEGMGLGLSIVRRICETHGGRVEIASTVGQGTIVKVWVPADGAGHGRASG